MCSKTIKYTYFIYLGIKIKRMKARLYAKLRNKNS